MKVARSVRAKKPVELPKQTRPLFGLFAVFLVSGCSAQSGFQFTDSFLASNSQENSVQASPSPQATQSSTVDTDQDEAALRAAAEEDDEEFINLVFEQ